jgi:hypothetical protein
MYHHEALDASGGDLADRALAENGTRWIRTADS